LLLIEIFFNARDIILICTLFLFGGFMMRKNEYISQVGNEEADTFGKKMRLKGKGERYLISMKKTHFKLFFLCVKPK
jgi:hypothetical protein